MDLSDIIGYIISALALFYFMGRGSKKRENEPKHEQDDQAQKLKDFLRSLEVDMEDQKQFKPPAQPKPAVVPQIPKKKVEASQIPVKFENKTFKPAIETQKLKTAAYHDYEDPYKHYVDPYKKYEDTYKVKKVASDIGNAPSYQVSGKEGISRADRLLSQLQSKKQMVLLHEIFGKPKGL